MDDYTVWLASIPVIASDGRVTKFCCVKQTEKWQTGTFYCLQTGANHYARNSSRECLEKHAGRADDTASKRSCLFLFYVL